MSSFTAEDWISHLGLEPHPEGGFFRETYRAAGSIPGQALPPNFQGGDRCYSTAIYFLLKSGQISALHRIQSDEVWHFYAGSGLTVVVISPDGIRTDLHLGADLAKGEQFQSWVPAGSWFGAFVPQRETDAPEAYALVGCTVAPGFDFQDFEMGQRAELIELFPQHTAVITELTNPK